MTKRTKQNTTPTTSQDATTKLSGSVKAKANTTVAPKTKLSTGASQKPTIKGLQQELGLLSKSLTESECTIAILLDEKLQLQRDLTNKKLAVEYWRDAYLASENKTWWKITKERWNEFWYELKG